jgi:hypothetical protein
MTKLGRIADLSQKAVEDPTVVHRLTADDLEHLLATHVPTFGVSVTAGIQYRKAGTAGNLLRES